MAYPVTLSEMQNPITRSVIAIEPPVEITSERHMNAVCNRLHSYCKIAWDPQEPADPGAHRLDPATIGADWLTQCAGVPG